MRLVLFDLDGTLVDSRADIAGGANGAREKLGLPPLSADIIQGYVGDGARNLMLRALGPEHAVRIDEALSAFFDAYGKNLLVRTKTYPGIDALLGTLAVPLAVLTNKPSRFARPLCEGLGIDARFAAICGEGDVPARKPDPRGALELCARFGVQPSEARLVGDSKVDAATARNAGIPFVGVTWGFGTEAEMRAEGAVLFARDAAELTKMLE